MKIQEPRKMLETRSLKPEVEHARVVSKLNHVLALYNCVRNTVYNIIEKACQDED